MKNKILSFLLVFSLLSSHMLHSSITVFAGDDNLDGNILQDDSGNTENPEIQIVDEVLPPVEDGTIVLDEEVIATDQNGNVISNEQNITNNQPNAPPIGEEVLTLTPSPLNDDVEIVEEQIEEQITPSLRSSLNSVDTSEFPEWLNNWEYEIYENKILLTNYISDSKSVHLEGKFSTSTGEYEIYFASISAFNSLANIEELSVVDFLPKCYSTVDNSITNILNDVETSRYAKSLYSKGLFKLKQFTQTNAGVVETVYRWPEINAFFYNERSSYLLDQFAIEDDPGRSRVFVTDITPSGTPTTIFIPSVIKLQTTSSGDYIERTVEIDSYFLNDCLKKDKFDNTVTLIIDPKYESLLDDNKDVVSKLAFEKNILFNLGTSPFSSEPYSMNFFVSPRLNSSPRIKVTKTDGTNFLYGAVYSLYVFTPNGRDLTLPKWMGARRNESSDSIYNLIDKESGELFQNEFIIGDSTFKYPVTFSENSAYKPGDKVYAQSFIHPNTYVPYSYEGIDEYLSPDFGIIYMFAEVKAPEGYIQDTTPHFFMFIPNSEAIVSLSDTITINSVSYPMTYITNNPNLQGDNIIYNENLEFDYEHINTKNEFDFEIVKKDESGSPVPNAKYALYEMYFDFGINPGWKGARRNDSSNISYKDFFNSDDVFGTTNIAVNSEQLKAFFAEHIPVHAQQFTNNATIKFVDFFHTNEEGKSLIENLPGAVCDDSRPREAITYGPFYMIAEVEAPEGYVLDETPYFFAGLNEELTIDFKIDGNSDKTYQIHSTEFNPLVSHTFTNVKEEVPVTDIYVKKLNANSSYDEFVDNAVFELYKVQNGVETLIYDNLTTKRTSTGYRTTYTDNGIKHIIETFDYSLHLQQLAPGDYILRETVFPEGFTYHDDEFTTNGETRFSIYYDKASKTFSYSDNVETSLPYNYDANGDRIYGDLAYAQYLKIGNAQKPKILLKISKKLDENLKDISYLYPDSIENHFELYEIVNGKEVLIDYKTYYGWTVREGSYRFYELSAPSSLYKKQSHFDFDVVLTSEGKLDIVNYDENMYFTDYYGNLEKLAYPDYTTYIPAPRVNWYDAYNEGNSYVAFVNDSVKNFNANVVKTDSSGNPIEGVKYGLYEFDFYLDTSISTYTMQRGANRNDISIYDFVNKDGTVKSEVVEQLRVKKPFVELPFNMFNSLTGDLKNFIGRQMSGGTGVSFTDNDLQFWQEFSQVGVFETDESGKIDFSSVNFEKFNPYFNYHAGTLTQTPSGPEVDEYGNLIHVPFSATHIQHSLGKVYMLAELEPVEGYVQDVAPIFFMFTDSQLTDPIPPIYTMNGKSYPINVVNEFRDFTFNFTHVNKPSVPLSIEVNKTDTDGNPLDGVKFGVYKLQLTMQHLPFGSVEPVAPKGSRRDDYDIFDPHYFLNEDGTVKTSAFLLDNGQFLDFNSSYRYTDWYGEYFYIGTTKIYLRDIFQEPTVNVEFVSFMETDENGKAKVNVADFGSMSSGFEFLPNGQIISPPIYLVVELDAKEGYVNDWLFSYYQFTDSEYVGHVSGGSVFCPVYQINVSDNLVQPDYREFITHTFKDGNLLVNVINYKKSKFVIQKQDEDGKEVGPAKYELYAICRSDLVEQGNEGPPEVHVCGGRRLPNKIAFADIFTDDYNLKFNELTPDEFSIDGVPVANDTKYHFEHEGTFTTDSSGRLEISTHELVNKYRSSVVVGTKTNEYGHTFDIKQYKNLIGFIIVEREAPEGFLVDKTPYFLLFPSVFPPLEQNVKPAVKLFGQEIEYFLPKSASNQPFIDNPFEIFAFNHKDDHTRIKIVKVDEEGNILNNASFQILNENKEVVVDTFTAGEYLIEKTLATGKTYFLHEVSAPSGYKTLTEDVKFTVKDTAEIQEIKVSNVPEDKTPVSVVLETKKVFDKELTGGEFEFELKDADGNVIQTATNNANGTVSFLPITFTQDNTGLHKYTITEKSGTNDEIIYDDNVITVEVNITAQGRDLKADVGYIAANGKNYFENTTRTFEVELSKQDITSKKELPGAKLRLTTAKGEVIDSWTSTDKPHVVKNLYAGTYVLSEVEAPSGYLKAENVKFIINPNGSVTGSTVLYDDYTKVRIKKTDENGNMIDGAVLQILDIKGNVIVDRFDASFALFEKKLEPNTVYYVRELSAPEGYELKKEDTEIVVKNTAEIQEFNVVNKRLHSVDISKLDVASDKELPGATLAVLDSTGKEIDKWTSTDEPHTVKNLYPGTYTLTEIEAPKGYTKTNDVQFTIHEGGMVTGITKLYNTPTKIKIIKKDSVSLETLVGVEFEIKDDKGNVVDTFVSSKEGYVKEGLPVGNYFIHEVKPLSGYSPLAEDVQFVITDKLEDIDKEVVIYNDRPFSVSLSKQDITTKEELPGAKLQLKNDKDEVIDEWTSKDTPHVVENILPGTYVLSEIEAPKGYFKAKDITFTVEEDGTVTGETVMYDDHTKVRIVKTDLEGNVLEGATLQILDKDNNVIANITNNEQITNKLHIGEKYFIKEIKAPTGYVLSAELVEFTVAATEEVQEIPFKNEKIPSVRISKKDITNGNELPGAFLQVKNNKGEIVQEFVSKDTPTEIELAPGTYTLAEIKAPSGYTIAKDVEFAVNEDGTITGEAAIYDTPTKVKILKKDSVSFEVLEGVEFELRDNTGNVIDTFVSSKEGYVKEGLPAGNYFIREVKPLDGYNPLTEDVEFVITDKLEDIDKEVVIYNDKPFSVSLSKQDMGTKEELPGAKLQLKDEAGNIIEEWTSSNLPHLIKNIKAGKYTLTEVEAPEGYLVAEPIEFTVNADGTVTGSTVLYDDYTKLEILKVDENDVPLSGATLRLVNSENVLIKEWVSTNQAEIFNKLPAGIYTLTEVSVPAGYLKADDIKIEIKESAETVRVKMVDKKETPPETPPVTPPATEEPPTPRPEPPVPPVPAEAPDQLGVRRTDSEGAVLNARRSKTSDKSMAHHYVLMLGSAIAAALLIKKKKKNSEEE